MAGRACALLADAAGRASGGVARLASGVAESALSPWAGSGLSPVAAGFAAALALLVAVAACALALWLWRQHARPDLAARESRNGDALLLLAREIDLHVAQLERAGRSANEQRRWARLCRRIAGEHLDCVNLLMLEGLRREARRSPRP
ncbi:hypothetical protein LVB77_12830 [Lysobacter sp. 5GHs7-4]|uniref:hypothetical protein n=1 Tax=Lysobacter sp. 5GHs7-4 TaxID=2904253 RepID=UPI001E3EF4D6|nr:hypothetical protein [Lysobacter sp. 5GHs7-4]UHQ21567.1 hypothetical protein LVB77_12830 [Lysobacter sp. 5GHs7-4]